MGGGYGERGGVVRGVGVRRVVGVVEAEGTVRDHKLVGVEKYKTVSDVLGGKRPVQSLFPLIEEVNEIRHERAM